MRTATEVLSHLAHAEESDRIELGDDVAGGFDLSADDQQMIDEIAAGVR
jgi:hypothetical protein